MRSIRINPALQKKLGTAVRRSGLTASAIIREGIDRECDRLLADNLAERWKDSIGQFSSGKRYSARDAGKRMADDLARERAQRVGGARRRAS